MPQPIRGPYTIPSGAQFGALRQGGRRHQGTDYHCPIGTPIYATGDGRVISNIGETGVGIGYGNYVLIAYAGGRVTLDGHLRERSPLAVGTVVNSSTVVAYVGITGNALYADPPGSHDHHQVWLSGVLTDPAAYYGTTTAGESFTEIIATIPKDEDDMPLIRVRDNDTGSIAIAQVGGGLFHELPSVAYETLYDGWGLWDRTKDINLPTNIYAHYKSLAAEARGTLDVGALAAAVIAKLPTGTSLDAAAVANAVEVSLADNFAAIPSAVLDAEVARLKA